MVDARRRILDASIELIAEEGVRTASFRAVARRAGVSHQAPYHYFGDYRGILAEIAREGFTELARAMRSAGDSTDDAVAALEATGLAYVAFARSRPGHFQVMFAHGLIAPESRPAAEAQATYRVLLDVTRRALDATGRDDLDLAVVAQLCWSTVHGIAALASGGFGPGRDEDGEPVARQRSAAVVGSLGELVRGAPSPSPAPGQAGR